jgi:hypothetical protein
LLEQGGASISQPPISSSRFSNLTFASPSSKSNLFRDQPLLHF